MTRFFLVACICANLPSWAQAVCVRCMMAPPIRYAVIEDMSETLQCSDAQRQAAAEAHEAYRATWTATVATLEADFQTLEQSLGDADASQASRTAARLLRRGLDAVQTLKDVDAALFVDIEDLLSDDQVPAARVWHDSMRGRWHATAPSQWLTIPDPLALIPPHPTRDHARRVLVQSMAQPARRRAEQTSRAFDAFARAAIDAYNSESIEDVQAAIQAAMAESDTAWADIARRLRRDTARALGHLDPLQSAWSRSQWLLLDGPKSYDDLAAQGILEWIAIVEGAALPPSARDRCAVAILEALEEIEDLDRRLDAGVQEPALSRDLQRRMVEVANALEEPIAAQMLAAASPPPDALPADEPHRVSLWAQWRGLQLRPLSSAQLTLVAAALDVPLQTLAPHAARAAEAIASNDRIASATPPPIDPDGPIRVGHGLDKARRILQQRHAALRLVEAIDAAFLAAIEVPPTRRRVATHLIAMLRLRPPARSTLPGERLTWMQEPYRLNLIGCALSAGLDLNDPQIAEAVCHAAAATYPSLLAASDVRVIQDESDAAYVPIEGRMHGPNAAMKYCREARARASASQRDAAIQAIRTIEAALNPSNTAAFRVALTEALWPRVMEPLSRARSAWKANAALHGPEGEAAFATLVGRITETQQRLANLLVGGLVREGGHLSDDRTLAAQALHDEQVGLVDAWMSDGQQTAQVGQ